MHSVAVSVASLRCRQGISHPGWTPLSFLLGFELQNLLLNTVSDWLWNHRDQAGLWDFGPGARSSIYFPLSKAWRNPLDRKIDCSIKVLSFLQKYINS